MKNIALGTIVILGAIFSSGCAVTTDKTVYSNDSEMMMISGRKESAWVSIYINGDLVIEEQSIFEPTLTGKYKGKKVVATCMHKSNWFSTEDKCDVYIDGKYAGNLDLSSS